MQDQATAARTPSGTATDGFCKPSRCRQFSPWSVLTNKPAGSTPAQHGAVADADAPGRLYRRFAFDL